MGLDLVGKVYFDMGMLAERWEDGGLCELWLRREKNLLGIAVKLAWSKKHQLHLARDRFNYNELSLYQLIKIVANF